MNAQKPSHYATLKNLLEGQRSSLSELKQLRYQRALSWLRKAENSNATDSQFIFLWLAINSAYAYDFGSRQLASTPRFQHFVAELNQLDSSGGLQKLLWQDLSKRIDSLFRHLNAYQLVSDPKINSADSINMQLQRNKAKHDAGAYLATLMQAIYQLRNMIVQRGKGSEEPDAELLAAANTLLKVITPTLLSIMIRNAEKIDAADAQASTMTL